MLNEMLILINWVLLLFAHCSAKCIDRNDINEQYTTMDALNKRSLIKLKNTMTKKQTMGRFVDDSSRETPCHLSAVWRWVLRVDRMTVGVENLSMTIDVEREEVSEQTMDSHLSIRIHRWVLTERKWKQDSRWAPHFRRYLHTANVSAVPNGESMKSNYRADWIALVKDLKENHAIFVSTGMFARRSSRTFFWSNFILWNRRSWWWTRRNVL